MPAERNILCVDYSHDNAEIVRFFLNQSGYHVETCETGAAGLDLARRERFALIMTEYRLPDMSGPAFCRKFRKFDPQTPLMFFTASVQAWEKEQGLSCGAQAYLIKPDDLHRVAETVGTLISETDRQPSDAAA